MAKRITGVFEREPGSGIWWIRYTAYDGKRHLEKVGRRGDAVTLLAKRQAEKLERRKLPERFRGGVTFGQLAKDALKHSREQNGSRSTHELELKLEIIGEDFNHRKAEDIGKQAIQDWLLEQSEEREWASATRNRWHSAFSLVFRVGIENEKIEVNPARAIKRKKESNGRTRFLSNSEEAAIVFVLQRRFPEHVPAFLISIHTGLRASEQWRLEWRDISLDRRMVTARATKNGDPERHIPLNATALNAFQELKDNYPIEPLGPAPVFLNSDGNKLRGHRDWFEPVIEEARLKDYTWHCNRHTFASRLVQAGVNLKAVQTLMGHKTIAMTMRYAHLAPDHLKAAVDAISSDQVVTKLATDQIAYPAVNESSPLMRVQSVA